MAVSFSVFCTFLLLAASPLLASTQYSCVTTWMVDQDAGTDCRGLSLDNRTDGVVCRSLQDALVALSADATSSSSSSCVEIIIRPGQYNLLRTVNITHSVVLRAESPHSVGCGNKRVFLQKDNSGHLVNKQQQITNTGTFSK